MKNSIRILASAFLAMSLFQTNGYSDDSTRVKDRTRKIHLKIGGNTVTATLADSNTARDFASLLPLTVELKDYANAEKISDLPRRLDIRGAPAGADPTVGDIAYYAPWGNLAIFYKDSPYEPGLVILGKVDVD